jgi:HK97 family phage prohead protease
MVTMASNTEYKSWLSSEDETIVALEKAQSGRTTLEDIADALDEYKRLYIAGLASPAEMITLSRAYPENVEYAEVCEGLKDEDGEMPLMVVGGPASVEVVDREGHLITTDALKKAFKKYMENFRGRNVMVMHSDVQVGHALPAYISKAGNIFKSGVDDKGLFFIAELRNDTKISNRVKDQIEKGGMKSYSIAGSATKSKDIKKSDGSSVLQVDDMELAEVTICEKGVNQNAHFELLKGDKAEGSCVDGSCLTKSHDPAPDYNIVAISKSEIPSFKDMFTSWIAKEQDSDKSTAIAIATAQAKKMGYKKFTEGSPGDKKRDKLAKEIKRSLKSAKEKAITKTFLAKDERPRLDQTRRPLYSQGRFGGPGTDIDTVSYIAGPTDERGRVQSVTSLQYEPNRQREEGYSAVGPQESDVDRFAGSEAEADRMRNMPKVKAKQSAIESQVASQTQNSITKQLFLDKLKEIV